MKRMIFTLLPLAILLLLIGCQNTSDSTPAISPVGPDEVLDRVEQTLYLDQTDFHTLYTGWEESNNQLIFNQMVPLQNGDIFPEMTPRGWPLDNKMKMYFYEVNSSSTMLLCTMSILSRQDSPIELINDSDGEDIRDCSIMQIVPRQYDGVETIGVQSHLHPDTRIEDFTSVMYFAMWPDGFNENNDPVYAHSMNIVEASLDETEKMQFTIDMNALWDGNTLPPPGIDRVIVPVIPGKVDFGDNDD